MSKATYLRGRTVGMVDVWCMIKSLGLLLLNVIQPECFLCGVPHAQDRDVVTNYRKDNAMRWPASNTVKKLPDAMRKEIGFGRLCTTILRDT